MRSLLADLDRPAIDAFLSAADTVMNSNTAGFADRLVRMLCDSSSPYRRSLDRERAEGLAGAFIREVLDPGSRPVTGDGVRSDWSRGGWSFFSVRPDFLCSTGYHTGEPPAECAYFDGGDSDTALLFYRDDVFYLLLTNGSP